MKELNNCINLLVLLLFISTGCARNNSNIDRPVAIKDKNPAKVNFPEQNRIISPDYFSKFAESPQYFLINNRDTTIVGKYGTTITIYADCLTDESGKPVAGP